MVNIDSQPFTYDPFSFAVHEDPWPVYQILREEYPVYHNLDREILGALAL